jgi:tetratricopeptide (TPR) repeat protein
MGFFNVYFFRYSFVADHFQYLASMGPVALAGAGINEIFAHFRKHMAVVSYVGICILLSGLWFLTWQQSALYANQEILYRGVIAMNPSCWMAHNNLGIVFDHLGRYDEAVRQYEEAVRTRPDFAEAHNNLGNTLQRMGRLVEAVDEYKAALRITPALAETHYNLGSALRKLGRLQESASQYSEALRLAPSLEQARSDLGAVQAILHNKKSESPRQ